MQLYSVSDEYINYLKSKFPRVYSNKEDTRVHTRKYLGVVIEIGVYKYYIPLSSPKEKHDYIMVDGKKTIRKDSLIVMRIVSGAGENKELKGTLQIGTMIPVPDEVIELYDVDHEPDQAYKDLVNEEIIYIRKHEKAIIKNAKILYSKRKAGEENRVVQNCLDFMAIEAECDKYISNNYRNYWESCWQEEDAGKLQTYLEGWKNYHGREVELEFNEKAITVFYKKEKVGTIRWNINPYHNRNYYLDMDFVSLDCGEVREMFEEIALKLKKPLQVMISSEENEKVAFLESAGFVCKRRCYETEAEKQDYIGQKGEREIQYAYAGQDVYKQCCELMLDRYCLLHKDINPWTGSREDFFEELPDCVAYTCIDEDISCFAFIENEEIAYVYGTDLREFRLFSQGLVTELLEKQEVITFESDDCDEMAMELKQLFKNQSEESYNTYIFEQPEMKYNETYATLIGNDMELKLIEFNPGNDVEIPFYWYEIIPKEINKPVGKISIRLGNNYHSYYNGHIGYEVDEEYRGHGFSYQAAKMVLRVAKEYGMEHIYLVCDEDNVASYKTIEKLGADLVELAVPPKDYFGWYEGITAQRIYKLEL